MTYLYRALESNPIGIWPFDTGFTDESGFHKDGTATDSPSVTRPIVSGGIQAYQFDGTDKLSLPIDNLMKDGKAFSLEVWVKPDVLAGTAALLARDNSGLFLTGNSISFNLAFPTPISASFDRVEAGNTYHVVGVYDGEDAYLYVNKTHVDSAPVVPGAVLADTSTTLRIEAAGGAVFTIDSPAVYNYALKTATVNRHFASGFYWRGVSEISAANGGNVYRIWDGTTNLRERTDLDFNEGGLSDTTVIVNGSLTNQYDSATDLYSAGQWNYVRSFEPETANLSGARLSWDSNITNLDVSVSLNGGTSYTPVANGAEAFGQQSLNNGLDILIRVNFPAGATQTVVDSITLAIYTSKDIFGTNEDLPALVSDEPNASVAKYDYEPNAFNNNAGIKFSGAYSGIMIPQDAEFGNYRALEMVVYLDTLPTSGSILKMGTASIDAMPDGKWDFTYMSSMIVNGVSVGAPLTMVAKRPYHMIMTFPDQPGAIYIGNNSAGNAGYPMRLNYLATYNTYIGILDAQKIYGAWVGTTANRIKDVNKVNIVEHIYPESAKAFRGYALTWSITGAG